METQTQPGPSTDKLVNPPTKETKMVQPQKKGQQTYKLFVLQPFMTGKVIYGQNGQVDDQTHLCQPGQIVEVDRKTAKDLCKKILGSYAFTGERHVADKDCPRHNLTRARLATPADLVEKKPLTPFDKDDDIFEE